MMPSTSFNPLRRFRRVDRVFRQNSTPLPTLPNAPNAKYFCEAERLRTFEEKWRKNYINYRILAQTGMYYLGLRDCVKCQFCNVTISDWQEDDDPISEHMKFSPACPLLRRQCTRNVPLDIRALSEILPPASPDECGGVRPLGDGDAPTTCALPQTIPACPHYALEEARITSFVEWPKVMKHKISKLVEAGFFYTGRGDQVQCFSCGVTINDWEEDDDPWVQHAIWRPCCKFLRLMRDKEFIDECIANNEEKQRRSSESSELPNPYDRQVSVASSIGAGDTDGNNLCKLCYLEERNAVFLPCGHVVACAKCASSVNKCPVCRLPFTDINRLYFS